MSATIQILKVPIATRYPENGRITSEGKGIQALSIAINKATPLYPMAVMVPMINVESRLRTCSIITPLSASNFP
jgi:hypothetical protein